MLIRKKKCTKKHKCRNKKNVHVKMCFSLEFAWKMEINKIKHMCPFCTGNMYSSVSCVDIVTVQLPYRYALFLLLVSHITCLSAYSKCGLYMYKWKLPTSRSNDFLKNSLCIECKSIFCTYLDSISETLGCSH